MVNQNTDLIDTYLFLKNYERRDGKSQVMVRIKLGYYSSGHKVITSIHDIKLLSTSKKPIHLSRNEFAFKDSNKELKHYFLEVNYRIRKAVIYLTDINKIITTQAITDYVYEDKSIKESDSTIVRSEFLDSINVPDGMPKEAYDEFIGTHHIDADTNQPVDFEQLGEIADFHSAQYHEKERLREIELMDYNQRYSNGHFDKKNIFEVFGFCWSINPNTGEPFVADSYKDIIFRLNDYRFNASPSAKVTDFDINWIKKFFIFLKTKGFATCRLKNYDPFTIKEYHKKLVESGRNMYTAQGFEKIVKHVKRYISILQEYELLPQNINTSTINARNYLSRETVNEPYTRQYHSLTVEEFNMLASYDFNNATQNLARDMFVFAVLGGGLRTSELYDSKLTVQDNRLFIYRGKMKRISQNPIDFPQLKEVIKRHNGIPKLLDKKIYNQTLKEIAEKLDFNRLIPCPDTSINKNKTEPKKIHEKLHNIFSNYFARKTVVTILGSLGISDQDIIGFTDHADLKTLKHYKAALNFEQKKQILGDRLNPPMLKHGIR